MQFLVLSVHDGSVHLSRFLLSVSCVVMCFLMCGGGRLFFLDGCWPTFYHVVRANCNINKRHRGPDTPSLYERREAHMRHCLNAFHFPFLQHPSFHMIRFLLTSLLCYIRTLSHTFPFLGVKTYLHEVKQATSLWDCVTSVLSLFMQCSR